MQHHDDHQYDAPTQSLSSPHWEKSPTLSWLYEANLLKSLRKSILIVSIVIVIIVINGGSIKICFWLNNNIITESVML